MSNIPQISDIIVLDDDDVDVMIMGHLLKKGWPGCSIRSAADQSELMALLEEKSPNFILSDVNLSAENGFDIANHVRKTHPQHAIPFIFMSGLVKESDLGRAKKHAPALLLEKPMGKQESDAFVNQIMKSLEFKLVA